MTAAVVMDDETGEMTFLAPVEVFRLTIGDLAVYTVKLRGDANEKDALFYGDGFAGDDIVVLTEV